MHIRALQKGIKRKKESEFCYTSDIDKAFFSSRGSPPRVKEALEESIGCKFLNSVHASYNFTAEEKNNLHRILL